MELGRSVPLASPLLLGVLLVMSGHRNSDDTIPNLCFHRCDCISFRPCRLVIKSRRGALCCSQGLQRVLIAETLSEDSFAFGVTSLGV